jgi:hypothetical protein
MIAKRKNIPKLIIYLLILTVIISSLSINVSYAEEPGPYAPGAPAITIDDVFEKLERPEDDQPSAESSDGYSGSKLALVSRLPQDDWRIILSGIIQTILGITGSLAFIAFTVGGVRMVTSQGNEERITKGKTIILYSVLALIIIATSYAIVLGITQLSLIP